MSRDLLIFLYYITPALATLIWPIRALFTSKPVLPAQWLLSVVQILSAMAIITFGILHYNIMNEKYLADVIYTILSVFIYPVLYLYVCSLTSREGVTRKDRIIAFLPPLIYIVAFSVNLFYIGEESYNYYFYRVFQHNDFSLLPSKSYNAMVIIGYWGFNLLLLLQAVGFMTIGYIKLSRYRKELVEFNPALKRKARSAYWITGFAFLSTISMVGVFFTYDVHSVSSMGLLYVLLLSIAVNQYLLGQTGYYLDFSSRQMYLKKYLQESMNTNAKEIKK